VTVIAMNRIYNVLYTCWVNCMRYWLGIWCFCEKLRFLQVCHDECSLKRAGPRSSEQTQVEHVECSLKRARPRSSEFSQVWLMNARSRELDLAQASS